MEYESFQANDGTTIAYQTSLSTAPKIYNPPPAEPPKSCIVLLHGFSGSSEYFMHNTEELSKEHWVVAPDLRGHGRSSRNRYGYHVARLAKDFDELIREVIRGKYPFINIYAVGCSIGAAVLWTYVELFTDRDLAGFVFVDQAPLQDRSLFDGWGEELAHYGCYDEATTLEAQKAWASDDPEIQEETYKGLVASCLGYRYAPLDTDNVSDGQRKEDEEFFTSISRSCDGTWLARLLSDHTRYDHREAIELIMHPVLVLAGKRSGCFSLEGMTEIVRRRQNQTARKHVVEMEVFDSGHWLFWEEPKKFNRKILDFVSDCETGVLYPRVKNA